MTPLRAATYSGTALTAAWILWRFGFPPFDAFIWLLVLTALMCGALLGAATVLAVRHAKESPRRLWVVAIVLIVLSLPSLRSYYRWERRTPAFIVSSDSLQGFVEGHNWRHKLLLYFKSPEGPRRVVAPRKYAHDHLAQGDSITVYVQRNPPHAFDTWPAGPDAAVLVVTLLWYWAIGGLVLTAYGPILYTWLIAPNLSHSHRLERPN